MGSKRAMRKYFHEKAFPSSDVDLFLCGLTVEEICRGFSFCLYEAVRDSVPWEVTWVRTKRKHNIYRAFRLFSASIVLLLRFSPVLMSTLRDVPTMTIASGRIRVLSYPLWASRTPSI
ncbi:hypothetical protein V8E53_000935 [Lactarius tabidus]